MVMDTPQFPVSLPIASPAPSTNGARVALPPTLKRFCLDGKVAVVTG